MRGIPRPFFVAFLVLCYAISGGGGGNYPQKVTGVIIRTVELVFRQNFIHFAKEIVWKFITESKTFKIAEYKDSKLEIEHLQFQNRLEILKNGMGLRIKNVSFKDSGMYIAEITLENNTVHKKSFNLSLYASVPDPFIRIDSGRDTCNVILTCYVKENATSLSYLWKYSINGSEYQPYNSTGATIQVSLQQGSSDIEFLCTVWNPADQKNVSYTLKSCQRKETHEYWLWWCLAPTALVIFLIGAFTGICCIKEKICAVFQTCCKKEPRLSVPETDKDPEDHVPFSVSKSAVRYSEYVVSVREEKKDKDPEDHVPFFVSKSAVRYSECVVSVHEKKNVIAFIMQNDKIELGDSEHPFISPDPEDSENEEEC
ncbi:SLAM family member 9-like [Rana temporaria]|uniref:SLAM family member 9-like n=1 Tax=Rana temporaria TaxID=8407 RepID=UPI001AACC356|nr:SLAM family member 9-like [Rana temporaria]